MRGGSAICILCLSLIAATAGRAAADFRFDRDTLAFTNSTVFEYHEGRVSSHKSKAGTEKAKAYTRRCFVMSRTVLQFYKFARFDPQGRSLDNKELAARVRMVIHRRPWHPALPEKERVVFPYANLRELSKARAPVLQENIGLGWPTYWRLGNFRMFFRRDDDKYQVRTHANLNAALDRGDFFVAPVASKSGIEYYLAYDPNHADRPRELKWSPKMGLFNYEKDEEFVGGFTRVYQIYGMALQ
jgi:hypothetical protein